MSSTTTNARSKATYTRAAQPRTQQAQLTTPASSVARPVAQVPQRARPQTPQAPQPARKDPPQPTEQDPSQPTDQDPPPQTESQDPPGDEEDEDDVELQGTRFRRVRMVLQGLQGSSVEAKTLQSLNLYQNRRFAFESPADATHAPGQEFTTGEANRAAEPLKLAAKFFMRCVDSFTQLREVLMVGLMSEGKLTKDHISDIIVRADLFRKWIKRSPKLRLVLDVLHETHDLEHYEVLAKQVYSSLSIPRLLNSRQLVKISSGARSSDISNLRKFIVVYLPKTPNEPLSPELSSADADWGRRGVRHPDICALFAPRKLHKVITLGRSDPRWQWAVDQVVAKKDELLATGLPWFLYDRYNAVDQMDGLFRGYLLFRVGRHVYTGPSSAMFLDKKSSARSNDARLDIHLVSAQMIAYICILRHPGKTSMGPSSYPELYYFVLSRITGAYIDEVPYRRSIRESVGSLEDMEELLEEGQEYTKADLERIREELVDDCLESERKKHTRWLQALIVEWNKQLFGNELGRARLSTRSGPKRNKAALQETHLLLSNREQSPDLDEMDIPPSYLPNSKKHALDSEDDNDNDNDSRKRRKKSDKDVQVAEGNDDSGVGVAEEASEPEATGN
ncbi:hypothetical protein AAF712_008855 [Marasmius tenuissimus]|uniref:Uncharacterized protein n=1 Tax=Marasmius tenuissimus TaxID=585030 RepID=A0ABR2ZSH2_9AGAR